MRLFTSTSIDPRKLSMLPHLIARQHPGRREFIHGKIHPQWCKCSACKEAA
jgi:hypothetical protein